MPPRRNPVRAERMVSCGISPRKTLASHHSSFCWTVQVRTCSSERCWMAMVGGWGWGGGGGGGRGGGGGGGGEREQGGGGRGGGGGGGMGGGRMQKTLAV